MSQEFTSFMSNLFEGVYIVDTNRKITFWNDGAEIITGYSKEEVVHSHCFNNILNHVDQEGNQLCLKGCPLLYTIQSGEVQQANVFLSHKDGHRVPVSVRTQPIYAPDGTIVGAIEAFTNNQYRKNLHQENQRLQELLITDELTGISNRRYVDFQLAQLQKESDEFGFHFGVLFIDIDHFKNVNDIYGHDIGDEVLKMVTRTIQSNVRKDDIFGRWGGEEFVMLCRNITTKGLGKIAEKIRVLVKHTILNIDSQTTLSVTISVGGSIYQHNENLTDVVKRADQNMYFAKKNGRNQTYIK
jgi:diguanylate cyclase (GGDEF)-like protein/PAS domain S-box-containing protein